MFAGFLAVLPLASVHAAADVLRFLFRSMTDFRYIHCRERSIASSVHFEHAVTGYHVLSIRTVYNLVRGPGQGRHGYA